MRVRFPAVLGLIGLLFAVASVHRRPHARAAARPRPAAARAGRAGPAAQPAAPVPPGPARPAARPSGARSRPRPYVEPAEFGVLLEFDGTRAELEAAGIRVGTQTGRIFTARVRRDEIGRLRGIAGMRQVQLARYLRPQLNVSALDVRADLEHAASGSPPVYAGRAGAGVIVGDVDTGIDFTQRRLRRRRRHDAHPLHLGPERRRPGPRRRSSATARSGPSRRSTTRRPSVTRPTPRATARTWRA